MLLKICDVDSFKAFFDLIYDSTNIVELKLDQEACRMSLLNNSHVCFYECEYQSDFFVEYQVDNIESVLLFVADFYNIIKTAKSSDMIELSTNDYSLKIVIEHDSNRRVFNIPLAEDYDDTPTPPSLDYNGSFTVSVKDLKQPCVDLDKIIRTDRFKMITRQGELHIVSPNDSMTKYEQLIPIDADVTACSIVNLHYINDLQKLSKINNNVELFIGDNIPVSWQIVDCSGVITVKGLIAPIMEEE